MNPVSPDSNRADSNSECIVAKLPNRRDFLRLRSGKRFSTPNFTLQAKFSSSESAKEATCRVGFTVTTRIGNAVVRNRIKRRLRSAVGEVFPRHGRVSHDYVLIARRDVLTEEFSTLKQDLKRALDHVHRNRAKGNKK